MSVTEGLPYTLLSLPRYAKILGINPVHFQGAIGGAVFPIGNNRCNDVWARYSWQFSDSVSHYDLAIAIQDAEDTIARELGWYPAPVWISQEVQPFPRHHRKDAIRHYGRNVRGYRVGLKAEYAKLIAAGRRTTTLISTPTIAIGDLQYLDLDGDGFFETARVTATTTVSSVNDIKIYHAGEDAEQEWEIRPARSKTLSAGTFTADFDSWLFIDLELQGNYPTAAGFTAIDIATTANYVTSIDVYHVYNDTTAVTAQFLWEPEPIQTPLSVSGFCSTSTDCAACAYIEQDGCLHVRDPLRGLVSPTPATYNATTAEWDQQNFTECRDPDLVRLWYYCGEASNRYKAGHSGDPLSRKWALVIAQIATARLERPFCTCGNTAALTKKWQADAAVNSHDLSVSFSDLENPIGTRYGEILAWRQIKRERHIIRGGGAI